MAALGRGMGGIVAKLALSQPGRQMVPGVLCKYSFVEGWAAPASPGPWRPDFQTKGALHATHCHTQPSTLASSPSPSLSPTTRPAHSAQVAREEAADSGRLDAGLHATLRYQAPNRHSHMTGGKQPFFPGIEADRTLRCSGGWPGDWSPSERFLIFHRTSSSQTQAWDPCGPPGGRHLRPPGLPPNLRPSETPWRRARVPPPLTSHRVVDGFLGFLNSHFEFPVRPELIASVIEHQGKLKVSHGVQGLCLL